MKPSLLGAALVPAVLAACEPSPVSTGGSGGTGGGGAGGIDSPGTPIPADTQRAGDPAVGYAALLNEGYVGCGVPYTAYGQVFGPAPAELQLPGRNTLNETMPYSQTRFTTAGGVDVVSPNCLTCHAGFIKGQLVVGLGDASGDYTLINQGAQLQLAQLFLSDQAEKDELTKLTERIQTIEPYIQTLVAGVNPADNLAAILFAHRDQETLAWSTDPILPEPPAVVVPVDVPPWWRMAKKNAMFYVAAGRGDHARIEMTASTLCVDSVAEAQAIDAYFPDIAAYVASIQPPAWDGTIDASLAAEGETVFASQCAKCHGTYGASPTYPNLLLSLEEVGTDPLLATGAAQFAGAYVDWFNGSFYGEIAHLEPQAGYVAPPLDGIWATAPYLHNGSVPTLAALLDSTQRPTYWRRATDANGVLDTDDYDDAAVGWNFTAMDHGQADEPDEQIRRRLYDTTMAGYSNQGHVFGDVLTAEQRAALIEYLKTL